MNWEGLSPPYRTIVADPPWFYEERVVAFDATRPMPYSMMSVEDIAAMDVLALAAADAHLYLWTTNRYLWSARDVALGWGFDVSQVLTWCKPTDRVSPGGGVFFGTTEFVLYCRRAHGGGERLVERAGRTIRQAREDARVPSTWFLWSRGKHSAKPPAFMDIVEQVSPGPYVELFAREPRLGWDSWGYGYEVAS